MTAVDRDPTASTPAAGTGGAADCQRYLKLDEVKARFGLSHSTIYRWMDKGEFPKPVRLGAGSVRWPEADLDRWVAARAAA